MYCIALHCIVLRCVIGLLSLCLKYFSRKYNTSTIGVQVRVQVLKFKCKHTHFNRKSLVQVAHCQTSLITDQFLTVHNQIKIINQTTNEIIYFAMSSSHKYWQYCTLYMACFLNATKYLLATSGRMYKGKGKGLDTCYSATYISQTRDQQRFTILEVAADWHEPMVPQRIMWPSIARANGQLDPRCS